MGVLKVMFLLFITSVQSATSISCKDESGQDIPTWSILKLPKGTDYYYYDVNSGFTFSPHSLNDTATGALAHTMRQLWDKDTQYVIYNDEPPNQATYNFSVAHSKAVWMWDATSAILVTHSIPKFPQGPQEQPEYTALMSNAWTYGQNANCLPISLTSLTGALNLVTETAPDIYEQSCQNCYTGSTNQTTTINPCSVNVIDDTYTQFMKPSTLQVDIWASCIAPYFQSQVLVESWIHGTTDGPYCPPDYSYPTLDIQSLKFPQGQSFQETSDHSKWGILQSPTVCFGDLNRVTTQMARAGTVYCWKDQTLWAQLNSLIQTTNTC